MGIAIDSRDAPRRNRSDESIELLIAQMKDHDYPMKKRVITIRVPILLYDPIRHSYYSWREVGWTLRELVPNDVRMVKKILTRIFRIMTRLDLEHVQAHLDEWLATISNS